MKRNRLLAIGIGLGAAGVALGLAAAQAQGDDSAEGQISAVAVAETTQDSGKGGGGETPLTGSDAEKATAAALAAVPGGTVIRVETDNDGVYEAHVKKADGTEVVVAMDAAFNVTGVNAGRGGHGGSGETALTGSDAEKATAAALAAVPGGTVIRVETDNDGVYEAHVKKTDGTEVVVAMDAAFNVTGVTAGRGGHGHHGGADDSAGDSATESSTA